MEFLGVIIKFNRVTGSLPTGRQASREQEEARVVQKTYSLIICVILT